MKNLDLHNKIALARAISPVSVGDNTAQVGQIVDRQGFSALEYAIVLGSIADADATFTVLVEHGDDAALADAAAVPDADLLGTELLAGFQFDSDNGLRKIGYVGNKRYNRITVTPANNSGAALIAVAAILGGAADAPTA
jgi:hypothetical protein